jgi:nucleoside-diphosphate-sugar epimerase
VRIFFIRFLADHGVPGVRNTLDALAELPGTKMCILTSSVATMLPYSRFFPLFSSTASHGPWKSEKRSDYDEPISDRDAGRLSYNQTKREGERLCRAANGRNGVQTAAVRAGMGIIATRGVRAILLDQPWSEPRVQVFVASYLRT